LLEVVVSYVHLLRSIDRRSGIQFREAELRQRIECC
jgi:hypothetical protein